MTEPLLVAKSDTEVCLLPRYANRHGLIAGATGTGKTVTLQRIAEGLSRMGVPVFMADVKGDLAGLSQKGEARGKIRERIAPLGHSGSERDPGRRTDARLQDRRRQRAPPARPQGSARAPRPRGREREDL